MGMGEPLHNYDETMTALRILADEHGLAMPPRRDHAVDGRARAGARAARGRAVMPNLAVSLHATTDEQRGRARAGEPEVPRSRDVIDACRRFPLTRRSRITFEYVLLAGVNDTPEDARRLATLLQDLHAKVNLIPLNAAAGIPFERPSDERIDAFGRILADRGITVIGAQEPRARHPRGLRAARRGRHEEVGGAAPGGRRSES